MTDSAWSEQISSCWDSIKTAEGVSLSHRLLHGVDSLEEPRQECNFWHCGVNILWWAQL